MKYTFLNKEISGMFTIPSGIVTTDINIIKRVIKEIPQIGVITTKSVGIEPKKGYREPILAQYAPGSFVNAVGLTNPGAIEFANQLTKLSIPSYKFLLTSIFGKDVDEFVQVAKILAPDSDGLELNLSCPHASGYGMSVGQDPLLVGEIIEAIKNEVEIPIVAKLSPNIQNIGEIVKAAYDAGVDGFCAINTVGPGYYSVHGDPVLSNELGGVSGKSVLPIGLKVVREIRNVCHLPIVACGGISSANNVREYQHLGAKIIGVGSALIGLTFDEIKKYFKTLEDDLLNHHDQGETLLKTDTPMDYKEFTLEENSKLADDLSLLVFDKDFEIKPGQFVFSWIPGIGEKPFSVLDDSPLTLSIQERGVFTKEIINLTAGKKVYFRGPYGAPFDVESDPNSKMILVGGGCGLAALYLIARNYKNVDLFLGAKDRKHLFYLEEAKKICDVYIATEDGSLGFKGLVSELLKKKLESKKYGEDQNLIFINCGPEKMVDAVVEIEKRFADSDKIYNSIDYITKCGVGICGSCADNKGRRACVEGPIM